MKKSFNFYKRYYVGILLYMAYVLESVGRVYATTQDGRSWVMIWIYYILLRLLHWVTFSEQDQWVVKMGTFKKYMRAIISVAALLSMLLVALSVMVYILKVFTWVLL